VNTPDSEEGVVETSAAALSLRARAVAGFSCLFVILILLMLISAPPPDPNAPPQPADIGDTVQTTVGLGVGQNAPLHFTLKDTDGGAITLDSFKGKVIVLNFWATWCPPCRTEIPDLIALQAAHRDELVVVGIDVLDQFTLVPAFAKQFGVNYTLLDGNGREDIENAYGPLWGLPTTFVINREGKIAMKHSGMASSEQLERFVEQAL
jgi:thiol-disulfide isomerase/thioredoxin